MGQTKMFKTVSIYGVGLIGGSLALVLKNRGLAEKVVGVGRSEENLRKAVELRIIDEIATAKEAAGADAIFLCGPVMSILPTLEKIAPHIKEGALVSDAGSTKKSIADGARKICAGKKFTFIGAHPIAGTEKSGAEAAFETLYDGHNCIITPSADTPPAELERLKKVWDAAGMKVILMMPEENDTIFGAVSHLPHMVVYALVNAVSKMDDGENLLKFAAGGFKDFTRIASSPPEMWADIAVENSEILTSQIDAVIEEMYRVRDGVAGKDKPRLMELFKKSNIFRKKLP